MRLLLIDTCGEVGSVALAEQGCVLCERTLPARTSSAELIPAIRSALAEVGWSLQQLNGVGVVAGPGSFTGVRVGLAAGKALCEVAGLRLATVSRLAVLAQAGGREMLAVLDAGRGEFFLRLPDGTHRLLDLEGLLERARSGDVWIAEPRLLGSLAALEPRLVALSAADALQLVEAAVVAGGVDVAMADAEYMRGEQDIYGHTQRTARHKGRVERDLRAAAGERT